MEKKIRSAQVQEKISSIIFSIASHFYIINKKKKKETPQGEVN